MKKEYPKVYKPKIYEQKKNLILKITIISPENKTCTAGEINL